MPFFRADAFKSFVIEREIFSLPVKLGGLGIQNPVLTSNQEFNASMHITHDLAEIIYRQEEDLSNYDKERVAELTNHRSSG